MNNWHNKASEQIQQDHEDGLISDKEYFQQMHDLDQEYREYAQEEADQYYESFFK